MTLASKNTVGKASNIRIAEPILSKLLSNDNFKSFETVLTSTGLFYNVNVQKKC